MPLLPTYPNVNVATDRLQYRQGLHFPALQPLLGIFLDGWSAGVEIPQHQVVDILELIETQNHSIGLNQTVLCQIEKQPAKSLHNLL